MNTKNPNSNPDLLNALKDFADLHDKAINSYEELTAQLAKNRKKVDTLESEISQAGEDVESLKAALQK